MAETHGIETGYKKIAEDSFEYKEVREPGITQASRVDVVFGAATLSVLQSIHRVPDSISQKFAISSTEEAGKIAIRESRAELARKYKDPRYSSYVIAFTKVYKADLVQFFLV